VDRAGGNRAAAARQLGLQRTYLYRLIKQLGLT
jgi:transcriptional regulator of acetoin/glycerol metabolism